MEHPFSGILVRYAMRSENSATLVKNPTSSPKVRVEHLISPPAQEISTNVNDRLSDTSKAQDATKSSALPDQLHINLWEVRNPSVLDLGIMIGGWQDVEAVIVDLPWEVKREHVEDLGSRLNSEKTVAAIFNEIVQYNGSADQHHAQITFRPLELADTFEKNSADAKTFMLLRLPGSAYTIERLSLGQGAYSSQLRIELPRAGTLIPDSKDPLYLRFRIDKVPQSVYSTSFSLADRNLLSSSTTTRIIDFRINVRRGIPDEILAGHFSFRFPKLKKIHFFLTIDRTQICDFESQNFIGCRSLVDEKIWNDYLCTKPSDQRAESMKQYLGYQWTASSSSSKSEPNKESVKDLVVLGRFSSHDSNISKTLRFVFVGLIFGMIGNGFWDVFKPIESNYLIQLNNQKNTIAILLILLIISIATILPWSTVAIRRFFANIKNRFSL